MRKKFVLAFLSIKFKSTIKAKSIVAQVTTWKLEW